MLITCSECGAEISDKAHACVKCGCPLSEMEQAPGADSSPAAEPGPAPGPFAAAEPAHAPGPFAAAEPKPVPAPERFAAATRRLKRGMVLNLIAVPLLTGTAAVLMGIVRGLASRSTDKLLFGLGIGLGLVWLSFSLLTWLAVRARKPWGLRLALIRCIATPVALAWVATAFSATALTALLLPAVGVPMVVPAIMTLVAETLLLSGCAGAWRARVALSTPEQGV